VVMVPLMVLVMVSDEVFLMYKFLDSHMAGSSPKQKNMKYFAIKNFSNRRITKNEFADAIAYTRSTRPLTHPPTSPSVSAYIELIAFVLCVGD
jgi:hypothetical protein